MWISDSATTALPSYKDAPLETQHLACAHFNRKYYKVRYWADREISRGAIIQHDILQLMQKTLNYEPMKYNDLQRVWQYVSGPESLKSLEVLTGSSGFDQIVVNAPEPSAFPNQTNQSKAVHNNPLPPPPPPQSQTIQHSHSGPPSPNSSNTKQPPLPPVSSFENPMTPSQASTGMSLARPMAHDDPSTLGYLNVKLPGSNNEVVLIISDNKGPANVSICTDCNSLNSFICVTVCPVMWWWISFPCYIFIKKGSSVPAGKKSCQN